MKLLALLAAQMVDANSTAHCLASGAHELNPLGRPFMSTNSTRNLAYIVAGDSLIIFSLGGNKHIQNAYVESAIIAHAMASISNRNVTTQDLSH